VKSELTCAFGLAVIEIPVALCRLRWRGRGRPQFHGPIICIDNTIFLRLWKFLRRIMASPYFTRVLTAKSCATGITVTANGVPASSPTKGSAPPTWLPPSIEFS
jgi:hypothetical protein